MDGVCVCVFLYIYVLKINGKRICVIQLCALSNTSKGPPPHTHTHTHTVWRNSCFPLAAWKGLIVGRGWRWGDYLQIQTWDATPLLRSWLNSSRLPKWGAQRSLLVDLFTLDYWTFSWHAWEYGGHRVWTLVVMSEGAEEGATDASFEKERVKSRG